MSSFTPARGLEQRLAQSAEVEAARVRAAERVAATARDIAPVGHEDEPDDEPGRFRDSIHTEGTRVVSDDPAAAYIVFGTSRTPPHDTFRRAAEMNGMRVTN